MLDLLFGKGMSVTMVILIILLEMVYWALIVLTAVWMVKDGNRRGLNWMGFWATAFVLLAVPNMVFPLLPLLPLGVLIAYLFVRARYPYGATPTVAMAGGNTMGDSRPLTEQAAPNNAGFQEKTLDPGKTIKVKITHFSDEAWLVKKSEPAVNQKIPLEEGITYIGRHPQNSVAFLSDFDSEVSRRHAKIEKVGNNYILTDLGSSNGTFVSSNSGPESQIFGDSQHVLQDGDIIRFGPKTRVEFKRVG